MYDTIEPYLVVAFAFAVGLFLLFVLVKIATKLLDVLTGDDNA